ncbi:MAG: TetR/AcrR family transcriptional regulator [Piscinibacter sp.]|nr:TetR/AcrR family transcriptional regulator [Piscinibacter sp.]
MARLPQTRKEDTHERIVEVAARMLRRKGYAGVGVAEVMREAGLTHGGFYAHFKSRDALLVEALERAGRDSAAAVSDAAEARRAQGISAFRALVESYLSDAHLSALERGCPVAALGSDMARQSEDVRAASAARVEALVARVRAALPPASAEAAAVVTATLVGALQLGRALGDVPAGRAMLAATRDALLQAHDHAPVRA